MAVVSAVPFTLKRSSDLFTGGGYKSTTETAHGLVRLEEDRLAIQWRVAVMTESMEGSGYETHEAIEPVREIVIPLAKVAGAVVTRRKWWKLVGPRLIITASDLLAFEKIAGPHGLKLKHPSKLVLRVKRADRLIAEEFAADLALTLTRLPEDEGLAELPESARSSNKP